MTSLSEKDKSLIVNSLRTTTRASQSSSTIKRAPRGGWPTISKMLRRLC